VTIEEIHGAQLPQRIPGQGYQLIATGAERYLQLAAACAASIRYWDPTRPIQLVTDISELGGHARLFDVVTPYTPRAGFEGPAVKLRMFEFAAFDETMFVDADCLMMKANIGRHWKALSAHHDVTTPGEWRREGGWYGTTIEAMLKQAGVDRLVKMNSGVFYFKRNRAAHDFFFAADEMYAELGNFTNHIHHGLGASDEPTFAVTFGRVGVEPYPVKDADGGSWMTSTYNTSDWRLSPTNGDPRFWKGVDVSPTLVHFVGLQPQPQFSELCDFYLNWADGKRFPQNRLQRWVSSLSARARSRRDPLPANGRAGD
jgi:hypothetical protein